jgi:hypothetical protein
MLLSTNRTDLQTKNSLKPQELLRWTQKIKNLDRSQTSLRPKELKVSKRLVRLRTFITLMPKKLVRLRITYELMRPKRLVR